MASLNPDTAGEEQLPANYAGLARRLDRLEALIGAATDDSEEDTLFGKIAAVQAVVDAL